MPHQQSSGSGAVHMGHVSGSVKNVTEVHQHFYATATATAAPTPTPTPAPAPAPAQPVVTAAHKEVLALMKPLADPVRIKVLDFMRREFGTAMVKELQPRDLYRVRMYVLKVRQSAGI